MIGVGTVIAGRYRVQEQVGAGGMGAVYRASDRVLGRDVAIKSLLPHHAGDEDHLARFMREARALAGVRHPNIIGVHDLLTLDSGAYLVLELVPGRSLDEEIRIEGPMSWTRCADLGAQVCGALAAAHARDVIHRDIKPSNILIEPTGVARVADFGIARLAGATLLTRTGAGVGTPGYWAPEQAMGEPVDGRTDLYSLGAVLYAAATGYPPFVIEGDSPAAVLASLLRPAPDPRDVVPDLPDAAAEVVMRAMSRDPADRFASAVEMARALRASAGLSLNPVTPMPQAETLPPDDALTAPIATRPVTRRLLPASGRGRLVGGGIALVAVAGLAGLGLGSLRDGGAARTFTPGSPVEAGRGTLAPPADWSTREGASLAGTTLTDGLRAFPPGGAGEMLAAGTTQAAGPTLLPARLLARLTADPGLPGRVQLGRLEAYRYRDLSLEGGDPLTVFVLPTTAGVVQTIACSAPPGRFAAFAPRCEAVAGTLRLSGSNRARPLGPSEPYARAVTGAVEGLNAALPALRQQLADATGRTGQAEAANQIAAAYSLAGDRLRDRTPGPETDGLNGALVDALDATADAYGALATAAIAGDATGYSAAGEDIAGTEGEVRDAIQALERAGYEVVGP